MQYNKLSEVKNWRSILILKSLLRKKAALIQGSLLIFYDAILRSIHPTRDFQRDRNKKPDPPL